MNDPYAVLGVAPTATDDEIKRAYRALARRYHPDANPGDPEAEAKFKEIGAAYEILSDPERRRRFDTFGDTGRGGGAGGDPFGGFGDLFDAFFGGDPFGGRRGPAGPQRGADAETVIELSLRDAVFGTTHTLEARLPVECSRCEGSGCEPGTHPTRCEDCAGEGEVRQVRRSILGQVVTSAPCGSCAGTGRRIVSPCAECRGDGRVMAQRTIDVDVPAGVDDGTRLRLSGRGAAAPRGGPPGDLYVTIRVAPDPALERMGDDLVHVHAIGIAQAALGTEFPVAVFDDEHVVVVPAGTQPGQVFRIRGAGVPSLRGRGRGDLLVQVTVEVPTRLDDDEAELLHRFAELRGEAVAPPSKGVFARLKSAFK